MRVYLAGPINGCTDAEASCWRDVATAQLGDVLSPMVRDYRGVEHENVTDIVEGDKTDIDRADIVLAYCPRPSVGTSMEVLYAWERGKIVVVVSPRPSGASPWLRYHAHHFALSLADAIAWIKEQA